MKDEAEFRRWLIFETWHTGGALRMAKERGAEQAIILLQSGRYDGFVTALSRFADRNPNEIRGAESLDHLWRLIESGPSFWVMCVKQTEEAIRKAEEGDE